MLRIFAIVGVAILLFYTVRWLSNQPRRIQWQLIAGFIVVTLLILVATGRAHWLAVVFAAILALLRLLLPLLQHIPLIRRVLKSTQSAQSSSTVSGEQKSTVQSHYIKMTLHHDSREIEGEVLAGNFKGRELGELRLGELFDLLRECQHDEESAAFLQAYLDHHHGETWREQAGRQSEQQNHPESASMSREEALQILGLTSEASEQEIIQAHRKLMQTLHPDRGGSEYLATKVNQAKEVLLRD